MDTCKIGASELDATSMRIWHYGPMENFSSFGIQGKLSAASLRLVLQYNKARKAAKLSPPKALDRTRFKVFVYECLQLSEKIKNFFWAYHRYFSLQIQLGFGCLLSER